MSDRLPLGPTSPAELLDYPRRLAQLFLRDADCLLPEMKTLPLSGHGAAKNILGNGVHLYTRYSGMGMAEIACHLYQAALSEEAKRLGTDSDWQGFRSMQAWDWKPSARRMLQDLKHPVMPNYIFGDMMSMLPKKLVDTIDGLAVNAGDNKALFWKDLQTLFPEVEERLLHLPQKALCFRRMEHHPIAPEQRDSFTGLTLCVAGVTCKDFSSMHPKRKGVLGPSGLPLLNFIFDVRRNKFDILLTKCTPMQDLKPFEDFPSSLYEWESFCMGPEDLGSWATRRRRFVVFWLRPECGGKVVPGLPMKRLLQLVRRRRPDAKYTNMFAMAPASHLALVQAETARSSGMAAAMEDFPEWEMCMNATKQARLQLQRVAFAERHGMSKSDLEDLALHEVKGVVQRFQLDDGFETWVDLDHTPSTAWGKQKNALPTLISHGSIFGLGINRCLIASELMASQGLDLFNVAGSDSSPSPSSPPWQGHAWPELSEAAKKDLCGNTINCEVLMSIIGFIIRVATPVGMEFVEGGDTPSASSDAPAVLSRRPTRDAKRARTQK